MSQKRKQEKRYLEYAHSRFEKEMRCNKLAESGVNNFIVVLDNLKPDFNAGKIIRSADAFGAREVHIVGLDYIDPVPAKGSLKWVPVRFYSDFKTCYERLTELDYQCFALDAGASNIVAEISLPLNSAFIIGHEEYGLSFDLEEFPEIHSVRIPQYGKVRCLNASVAASVVMYEYVRQFEGDTRL